MTGNRISLRGFMAVIALLAIEFAAMRAGSSFWYSAIYTLTVVLLLLATLAARYRRGRSGAFWFGFALFGWAYLCLVLGPWSSSHSRDTVGFQRSNPDILTTQLLWSTLSRVRGSTDSFDSVDSFDLNTTGIAHLMLTLLVAIGGGWAAVVLRGRRSRTDGPGPGTAPLARRFRTPILLIVLGVPGLVALAAWAVRSDREPIYFPEHAFDQGDESNAFTVDWYSKHLKAMREPSLWELAQGDRDITSYRMLWLPSFHHPAAVRVSRSGGSVSLRVVILDGLGGYEPGQIAVDKTIKISEHEWRDMEERFERLKYWTLPTEIKDQSGSDGDQLILEGASPGRYHIVDRWEPDGEYLALCRTLADWSGTGLRKAINGYHRETP